MPTDPIPLPLRPAPIATVVSWRAAFRIGQRRYALDIDVRITELRPTPAEVISITRRPATPAKAIIKDSPIE